MNLEFQKELVRHKIATERKALGGHVQALRHSAAPASAAASFGRMAGSRIGLLGSALALFGRGPRLGTWVRVAAVAYLATPLVLGWLRRRRSRAGRGNGGNGTVAE